MPAYSSHLLQPLDISCFSVLKRSYGTGVEEMMRNGINHVTKDDFISLYQPARKASFTLQTIQNGFKAAGLVPFNLEEVLSKLDVRIRTPTPDLGSPNPPSSWIPQTLCNIL